MKISSKVIVIVLIIAAVIGYFIWKNRKTSQSKTTDSEGTATPTISARAQKLMQIIPNRDIRQQLHGKAVWYETTNPTQAVIQNGKVFNQLTGQYDAQGRTDLYRFWMDAAAFDMYKLNLITWLQYAHITGQRITKAEVKETI